MAARLAPTDPSAASPFRWHPEPDSSASATPRPRARPSTGRRGDLDGVARLALRPGAWSARWACRPATPSCAAPTSGRRAEPGRAPDEPATLQAVLDEFATRIAPHTLNSFHPRALSYFTPPPLIASIVGEVLAQWTNQGVDVWHAGPVAAFVEEEVGRWLCDLVGYGEGSFGLLTSGGVMANFIALALVRDVHLRALTGAARPPRGAALEGVRVYASDQAHFSIARALDELGFPPETLALVPADDAFRLHAAPGRRGHRRAIAPQACGRWPSPPSPGRPTRAPSTWSRSWPALAATRGPVAPRRRGVRRRGAACPPATRTGFRASTSPTASRSIPTSGSSRPTTWARCSSATGATCARPSTAHPSTTAAARRRSGPARTGDHADAADAHAGQLNFYKLGFEGTRRFRGLKLWATWKHLGTSGLGRLIERNDDIAAYLAARCAEADDLEALPERPELSVVCFRHLPGGSAAANAMAPADLDAHQDRLATALEQSGDGWLSTTSLRGRTWLRAGIVNYLTGEADIDRLLATLRRLA